MTWYAISYIPYARLYEIIRVCITTYKYVITHWSCYQVKSHPPQTILQGCCSQVLQWADLLKNQTTVPKKWNTSLQHQCLIWSVFSFHSCYMLAMNETDMAGHSLFCFLSNSGICLCLILCCTFPSNPELRCKISAQHNIFVRYFRPIQCCTNKPN